MTTVFGGAWHVVKMWAPRNPIVERKAALLVMSSCDDTGRGGGAGFTCVIWASTQPGAAEREGDRRIVVVT